MTRSLPAPSRRPIPLLGEVEIGPRAARVLTTELARDNGPKTGLVLAAAPDRPVVAAAVEALLPGDRLTLVAPPGAADDLRRYLAGLGSWVEHRVVVTESAAEVDPADVVVVAEPVTGTAESVRTYLDEVGKQVAEGGVLAVAVPVLPGLAGSWLAGSSLRGSSAAGSWRASGAAEELDRQSTFAGAGTDLVLRNRPPLRVHRLRFTPARVPSPSRLTPALRTSSVPLTRGMSIDSNGVAAAAIALGLAATARLSRPGKWWLLPALASLPIAAFFRDPERGVPEDSGEAVLAASDGRVLSVERLRDPRLGGDEMLRIAVFLSILDVHINRAPVAGRVVDHFVCDGGYAPANARAAEHNVAAYTVLDTEHGRVAVVQRTGLIARRIVHRAPVGSLLARGERFGLIRFGSRTDVYLPVQQASPAVAPGDVVRGGTSVIARWNS